MTARRPAGIAIAALAAATLAAACSGGSGGTTSAAETTAATPTATGATAPGAPPDGVPPSGAAPGSGPTVEQLGAYVLDGETALEQDRSVSASDADTSGVLVTGGGTLTLRASEVSTSGDSSSSDESSFYGLNAVVLVTDGSTATVEGSQLSSTGDGANGAFAYGTGSSIALAGTTIDARGQYAHGVMASGGGAIEATNLVVATAGASSAAVATDRGGGTIDVRGGTYTTAGYRSPGLYSTGTITVSGARITATGAEAAVVEGSNSIVVTDGALRGAANAGVMLYQSFSGDAEGSHGSFSMTGGSLAQADGPLLYVTNASATITLSGVELEAASGVLLEAAADQWGTEGQNGGYPTLVASGQALVGDVVVDAISDATLQLADGSTLEGALNAAGSAGAVSLALDATSAWTVTADSHVGALSGLALDGTSVTNVTGNGHAVTYDADASPELGGRTYELAGGGTLAPA